MSKKEIWAITCMMVAFIYCAIASFLFNNEWLQNSTSGDRLMVVSPIIILMVISLSCIGWMPCRDLIKKLWLKAFTGKGKKRQEIENATDN